MTNSKKAVSAPAIVPKMTVAQAVRDVFIASINKGQFPFAIIGAVVLLALARMPENDVGVLVHTVIARLVDWSLAGYVLFAATVFGWFFHTMKIRRHTADELDRIYAELKKRGKPAKTGATP